MSRLLESAFKPKRCTHVMHERLPILVPRPGFGAAHPTHSAWYCKRCGSIGRLMLHYRRPQLKWEKPLLLLWGRIK